LAESQTRQANYQHFLWPTLSMKVNFDEGVRFT
jgi:hypothetical protein